MFNNVYTVKRVCSIRFILIVRFLFGYYFDIHKSPVLQILSKSYCVTIVCLSNYIFYINTLHVNRIVIVFSIIESILLAAISLYNKEEYVLEFFRYRPITDSLPFAKESFKLLGKVLTLSVVAIIGSKAMAYVFFCISLHDTCYISNPFKILAPFFQSLSLEMGSFSFVLVFALLYCRVKIMKNTLLKRGFRNSPRNRFRPRKYIGMYDTILRTLEDANNPLKFLVYSVMFSYTPSIIYDLFRCLHSFKESGPTVINVTWLYVMCQPLLPILISAILLDMAAEDILYIRCYTLGKYIDSNNERERSELKHLYKMLEDQPLKYNLFRVFPLSVKPILGALSFAVTTIIAILQIQKF